MHTLVSTAELGKMVRIATSAWQCAMCGHQAGPSRLMLTDPSSSDCESRAAHDAAQTIHMTAFRIHILSLKPACPVHVLAWLSVPRCDDVLHNRLNLARPCRQCFDWRTVLHRGDAWNSLCASLDVRKDINMSLHSHGRRKRICRSIIIKRKGLVVVCACVQADKLGIS